MEKKAQVGKKKVEGDLVTGYPGSVEREMEYWLREKRASMMCRIEKSHDLNTSFSGAVLLHEDICAYPELSEVLEALIEEDEDLVYDLIDELDFESESPVPN
jgi:hypothetical protein